MKNKTSGRSTSIPAGLALGTGFAMILTLIGSVIITKLVHSGVIGQEKIGYGIMVMLIIASCTGALLSLRKTKRRKLIVTLLSFLTYWLFLLSITALFFGGQYETVAETGLLVLCGSLIAFCVSVMPKEGRAKKKIRLPNR